MAKLQSLDEVIGKKSAEFAVQVRRAASAASKEEEIRTEVERQLAFLEQETGLRLQGQHGFTVAKRRIDSFCTRVPTLDGSVLGHNASLEVHFLVERRKLLAQRLIEFPGM